MKRECVDKGSETFDVGENTYVVKWRVVDCNKARFEVSAKLYRKWGIFNGGRKHLDTKTTFVEKDGEHSVAAWVNSIVRSHAESAASREAACKTDVSVEVTVS